MAGRSEQGAVAARPWAEEARVARNRGRRQRPLPKRKSGPVADTPAPSQKAPVDNQGLPGSDNKGGPMGGVEDGQRLQDEADRLEDGPRIIKQKASWLADNDMLREEIQKLTKSLEDREKENKAFKEDVRLKEEACSRDQRIIRTMETQLSNSAKESADCRAEAQTERQRVTISQGVIEQLKQEVASITSKLAGTTHDKHQLEADRDEAEVVINGLHERVDALESEVTSRDAVATENNSLQGQIAQVHTSLEDAFSDMAKGLTIEEKFTYVREHQAAETTGRPRVVSGASLHEETNDVSDSGSRHGTPAPKQTLTFTGITSVHTAPIAAVNSVSPFEYSGINTVETAPIAASAVPSVAAAKSTSPLAFSDTITVETTPIVATSTTSAEPEKLLPPAVRRRLLAMSNTAPLEPAPVIAAPVARAPRVVLKTKRVYIETPVDRPFVPWWMWVLFLLGILACIGGFAGLLREKQIWLEANDLAYERLMGGQQETWMEWIGLGVGDLLPDMGSGMMGHSMFT
jgi:hypothetical protein